MGHRLHRPQSAQAGSGAELVRSTVHGPRSKAGACLRPSVATLGVKLAGRSLLSQRLRHKVDGLLGNKVTIAAGYLRRSPVAGYSLAFGLSSGAFLLGWMFDPVLT